MSPSPAQPSPSPAEPSPSSAEPSPSPAEQPRVGALTDPAENIDDIAAPLDALLIDAAFGPVRRFAPDISTVKFAGRLCARPATTASRLRLLAAELARVAGGESDLTPARGDRRFTDPAWAGNPLLRRLLQTYLATERTADELIASSGLSWRDDQRVRFLTENLFAALAPSNFPMINPESARAVIDTGGLNFIRGGLNLIRDFGQAPRIPQMVDGSGFTVGGNLGITPGAVVLRTEVFELIQYEPQTPTVRAVPVLVVPPTINKFYVLDLAPGRSWIEYLVRSGQQVFVLSWRNPDARHAGWGMDTYLQAVHDALQAVERICRIHRVVLTGVCSGGILASLTAAQLAAKGELDRLAGFTLLVTVLDQHQAGIPAALANQYLARAATAVSRRRGFLDGKLLAEVFAWLRPGDLVWHYWVNNYLLGRKPPAFDVLFWNADTTRMPAQLHADLVDVTLNNQLAKPAAGLNKITTDAYVVAGVADHITPWQSCYRSTGLLGGDARFVLSTSGHIAALVNPAGNTKSSYRINPDYRISPDYRVNPGSPADPQEWLAGASTEAGSWWPDYVAWLSKRSGPDKRAPKKLGGGGLTPLIEAPGTYVLDR